MTRSFAPSNSPRPAVRVTPEERRLREIEQDMAEQFAALEARADMDPWLADNPLRRLGYRSLGGLRGVDFEPGGSSGYPNTRAAYTPEDRTIRMGGIYFSNPVLAHESGHAGVDFVNEAVRNNPELLQVFRDLGLNTNRMGYGFEEALVELGDDPSDTWNLPFNRQDWLFPEATKSIESTIQYLPEVGTEDRDRVERMNAALQQVAEDELRRRGEPPRAVMREPGPGSIFYREPERRGGLLGILDRIRGN